MENKPLAIKVFSPTRRKGLLVMGSAGVLLIIASGMAFYLSYAATSGLEVILWIVLGAILALPLLLLAYRGYALTTASYDVRREGLKLKWGLRSEEIPTGDIEWVRPARDLAFPLPLPRIWWAGAILGMRDVEGLGPVEYMAAEAGSILLVTTPDVVYAISPEDENRFIRAFRHASELGSLTPIQPQSVQPSFILGKIWQDHPARWLILGGLGLVILLLTVVTIIIPTRETINLGFTPLGVATLEPTSPERLLLLPVLNALAWLTDMLGGSFFFRQQGRKALAYLLWGSSPLLGLMLTVGVILILSS
ncbi:MAG: PH domain-containing protein [Anaerolineaceae bacterium]